MLSDIEGISDLVDDDLPLEDAGATPVASTAPAGDAVLAADAATGEPKAEVGAPDAETAEADELEAHEAALGAAEAEAEALPDPRTLLVRQEEEPPAEPTASEVSGETPAAAPTADHGVAGGDEIQEEAHLAPPPKMDREAAAVHAEDAAVAADAPTERPEVLELTERTDAGSGDGAHADEVEEGVAEVDTAQTEDAVGNRGDAEAPGADEEHGDAPLVETVGEPTPKEGVQEDGGAAEAVGVRSAEWKGDTVGEGTFEEGEDALPEVSAEPAKDAQNAALGGAAGASAGETGEGDAEEVGRAANEVLGASSVGEGMPWGMGDGAAGAMDGRASAGGEGGEANAKQGVDEEAGAEEDVVGEGRDRAEGSGAEEVTEPDAHEVGDVQQLRRKTREMLETKHSSPRAEPSGRGGADGAPAAPTRHASDGGGLVRASGGAADAVAEARALADAAKAAALDSAVAESQAELDELRAAVPPRDPRPAVAERRRRRDALRGQTIKLRTQLEQLAADRLALERKLERLSDREAKMAGSTYRLPPAPVEASEEQVRGIKEEIKRLTALNAEMELQAPAQDEVRRIFAHTRPRSPTHVPPKVEGKWLFSEDLPRCPRAPSFT